MDERIRGVLRPVLVLVLVGVIMGLGIMYGKVDSMDINADTGNDTLPNGSIEENDMTDGGGGNDTVTDGGAGGDNVDEGKDEPPAEGKEPFPKMAVDGIVSFGDSTTEVNEVSEVGSHHVVAGTTKGVGGDLVTSGERSLYLAEIAGESVTRAKVLREGEDVTFRGMSVGTHGIAVATEGSDRIYLYVYDYDGKERIVRRIENAMSVRMVDSDHLAMVYRRGNSWVLDTYDYSLENNSILTIDIDSDLMAVYTENNSSYTMVFSSGDVVRAERDRLTTIKKICGVDDIIPIMRDGKVVYAVLSRDRLYVYDREFCYVTDVLTHGGALFYADRLYVIDGETGSLDYYCTCGEYAGTMATDIMRVTFIDYEGGRLVYESRDGRCAVSTFDNILRGSEVSSSIAYLSLGMTITYGDAVSVHFTSNI